MTNGTVLLVESQDDARRQMSAWLEEADFEVLLCPGPGAPDYVCLGGRGLACPLSEPADVVVVSLRLRSDDMMEGTPAWVLLAYYANQGKRVVALTGSRDSVHPLGDKQVTVLKRPAGRAELVDAVAVLAHWR